MAMLGNALGGLVVRKAKLDIKRVLCIIMVGCLITLAVSSTLFFFVGNDSVPSVQAADV